MKVSAETRPNVQRGRCHKSFSTTMGGVENRTRLTSNIILWKFPCKRNVTVFGISACILKNSAAV